MITAFSVSKSATPAAVKMPETWTPDLPPTERVTGSPWGAPSPPKIAKVAVTGESPGLKRPTLVRNPAPEPPLRIEVRTVRSRAEEAVRPGMYIPTVGTGEVE